VDEIHRDYLHHLFLREEWAVFVEKSNEFEGKIAGVSKEGRLRMELKDGSDRLFDLKEISFPNL
jgi:BirA family biotin operon repressor/biotin-[acetyl-CoA-carboxylase] ligase